MAAQRELVDALQQQGEPIGGARRLGERVQPGGGRAAAQQPRAELGHGRHHQLLVGPLDEGFDLRAKCGRRARARGEQRDPLGRAAVGRQPGEARQQRVGLAGARAAEHEQRAVRVYGGLALRFGKAAKGVGHNPRI